MDPDDFGRLPEQTPGYGPPAARTRAQLSSARRADSLDTDHSNHPALRKQAESRGSGFLTRQQHPASFAEPVS